MIAIIGAGLAGLSAAYHLKGREFRLFEKEARPGGLARTEKQDGLLFDRAGHLLHFRDAKVKGWVQELLGDNWLAHERRATIFSQGVETPYPFQAHTYGLPKETVRDCVQGFIEACLQAERHLPAPDDLAGWFLHTFGEGFARHFFFPFNQKVWRRDLREMTADWVSWSVPRPSLSEVIAGAIGLPTSRMGYNSTFLYPRRDGIESLPRALAAAVGKVETNREVMEVHPKEKMLVLEDGEKVRYRKVIATLPLPELIRRIQGAPAEIQAAAQGLKQVSVLCIHLGVAGPPISKQHWIYFPEPRFPFYRCGFYSNYYPAPAGRHSLVLELSLVPEELLRRGPEIQESCLAAFRETGFLQSAHRVEHLSALALPYAYVIYDRHRKKHLPGLLAFLRGLEIYPAGRYARWEYGTMEDALSQGREAAAEVRG